MADLLETLRQLQAVDSRLYRLRAEQRRKPEELQATQAQVAQQQAQAQAAEARLKELQMQQKQKELDLAAKEGVIKKLQMQLSQVKTNKEYTTMQHEIDQHKADVSLLEEEVLKLMDAIEQASREHKAQAAQVAQQQAALRQEEVRVAADVAALEQQAGALEAQRRTITPLIERASLAVYERVLANREGLAMVPLAEESCSGCHMVQPPQVVSEVYLKAKLIMCESCNRILYVDESAISAPDGS